MQSNNSRSGFNIAVLLLIGLILICHVRSEDGSNSTSTQSPPQNETIYLYLLAVPESQISKHVRFRQEDEDGPAQMTFAQTGQLVGQIIQGILGMDFRPVFAGGLGFVQEPMAHRNLQSFLGTVAPGLNFALREVYNRAAMRLGFRQRTTPTPVQSASQKPAQSPIQEIVYGSNPPTPTGGKNISVAHYNGNDLPDEQEMASKLPPSSTTSWQFVLNQIYTETTSVAPLPFIRVRSTLAPDDEDYDAKKLD